MKKHAVIILLILILAIAAGIVWWNFGRSQGSSQSLTLYGNVDIRTAQLALDANALVASMRVEEGAKVQAGEPTRSHSTIRNGFARLYRNRAWVGFGSERGLGSPRTRSPECVWKAGSDLSHR